MITVLDDPLFIESVARAAHEVNNAYRRAMGQKPYQSWVLLSEAKKKVCTDGVYAALGGVTPEQMHENWMKSLLTTGWKYGPAYDEEHRIHPALVSWEELPNYEKAKDQLFIRVVRAMVDAIETGRQK